MTLCLTDKGKLTRWGFGHTISNPKVDPSSGDGGMEYEYVYLNGVVASSGETLGVHLFKKIQ